MLFSKGFENDTTYFRTGIEQQNWQDYHQMFPGMGSQLYRVRRPLSIEVENQS
jgi:hypothetical protein